MSNLELAHLQNAILKMKKFCAYQERSHSEVRNKLLKLKVYGDDLENVMSHLIQEDYLNEERFARSFARGKFRMNKWGMFRIRMELKRKGVSDYCIKQAMEEIDEEEYTQCIDDLLSRKLRGNTDWLSRKKAQDALVRKGFETGLVRERIAQLLG